MLECPPDILRVRHIHESFSPRQRSGMSYKHVGTAGDLVRFGCALKVECTFCGAAWTWNAVDVYNVHGNRQLTQLARRLKCRRCKKKEAKVTVLDPVWPSLVGTERSESD